MKITEPTITYKTVKDPENVFGRHSRANLSQRNWDVEAHLFRLNARTSGENEDNVFKKRHKLNQQELPKSTFPKLYDHSADRLLPLTQNNRDRSCFSLAYADDGPFYNRSFYFTDQFKSIRAVNQDPNYNSAATKHFRSTVNSFHK